MNQDSDGKGSRRRGHGRGSRGSEDLRFLELELAESLQGKATGLAREAYTQLVVDRIKTRLREQLAEQIDALADLAADDLIADIEANLDIERRIKERASLRKDQAERLKAIFGIGDTEEEEADS